MFQLISPFSSCPDLDSAVSSGGLDQILTPPAGQTPNQPRTRSFFQSVIVTKVVKPDGVRETVHLNLIVNHILIYVPIRFSSVLWTVEVAQFGPVEHD